MGVPAVSFEVRSPTPSRVVQEFIAALRQVPKATSALIFCSGAAAQRMFPTAEQLHAVAPHLAMVFLSGPGVFTERGELEDTAVSGLVWDGGGTDLRRVSADAAVQVEGLRDLLRPSGPRQPPTLLFIRSEDFDPEPLWQIRDEFTSPWIFGAGTYGDPGIVCAGPDGVHKASAASLHLRGLSAPQIRTAHSCRLLCPPQPITQHEDALVLEVGGEPALDLLQRLGSAEKGQPLVFTVLARPTTDPNAPPELLVRGIQGIDPDRKALLVSDEVKAGLHLSFAVRDPGAARTDLDLLCRRAAREIAGSVPRFILYFNCTGRGRSLHGSRHVDTRILKEKFAALPIAGFQSAFEIAPFAGAPALQLYTGVLAIFSAPS